MKQLLLAAFLLAPLCYGAEGLNPALIDVQDGRENPAPRDINLDSYLKWADPILKPADGEDYVSAFTPLIFDWYDEQVNAPLPAQVYSDKDKIYIDVTRPLNQTIEMEANGDIEEATTVGAEVYSEMTGTVDQALEAMLYRWGKPVGKLEGFTYPAPSPFARRIEYFAPNTDWGDNAYASLSLRRDGGIVKDVADRYMMVVRGSQYSGYDVFMQYIKPGGKTYTTKVFAIATIRDLGKGKVSYKISTRYQGQSYKILGNVNIGRKTIGFNLEKVRAIQLDFAAALEQLRTTGAIPEKKSDIEWGK